MEIERKVKGLLKLKPTGVPGTANQVIVANYLKFSSEGFYWTGELWVTAKKATATIFQDVEKDKRKFWSKSKMSCLS